MEKYAQHFSYCINLSGPQPFVASFCMVSMEACMFVAVAVTVINCTEQGGERNEGLACDSHIELFSSFTIEHR